MTQAPFAVLGTAFHAPRRGVVDSLEDCLIEVGDDGRVLDVARREDGDYDAKVAAHAAAGRLTRLKAGQYLLPGFVDLHVHAPQFAQLGKALDAPLEEWLQRYTFPLEARFSDLAFAEEVYRSLVDTLIANGTTTAVYFATIHVDASVRLAEICLEEGQRALVGKVAMDDPAQCPDFYRDASAAAAVADTEEFISRVGALQAGRRRLVWPVITPRFLPTSSDAMLQGLAALAARTGCHIQTHCSESDWEVRFSGDRHGCSDTAALGRYGLLTDRTILAHANFVSPADLAAIRHAGACVAHCPLSNAYFADAVFPLRAALDMSVKVGLGTDISAGYSPAILDNARTAMLAARLRHSGTDAALERARRGSGDGVLTIAEAFWLATAGGGAAIGLPVGTFAPGMAFDAIVVDATVPNSNLMVAPQSDTLAEIFEKIILHCARPNIARVWIDGVVRRGGR